MAKKRKSKPGLPPLSLHADTTSFEEGLHDAGEAITSFQQALAAGETNGPADETLGLQDDRAPTPAVVPEAASTVGQDAVDAMPAKSRGRGRPVGSQSANRPLAVFKPPRCPSCSSTRREPFRDGPVADDRIPIVVDGQPYNRQLWRNTRCVDCGQSYRIIEYRFEPE